MKKIDIVCSSGSPIGVIPSDIYGKGVGGAELALMSLAETLGTRGHKVTVYNNPTTPGIHENVNYLPLDNLDSQSERDDLILFRVPYSYVQVAKGKKIFWSCDQWTAGNYSTDIFPFVEKTVCISPRHVEFFKNHYNYDAGVCIDLGVRLEDYTVEVERIKTQAIFCSVPDRGLPVLHAAWPLIVQQVPEANLVITSDYRLWGTPDAGNTQHKLMWMGLPNVRFLGLVPRTELVKLQKESGVLAYPCTYDELFCITLAETEVAGAIPVVSQLGSLPTTQTYGYSIAGNPATTAFIGEFVESVVKAFRTSDEERENGIAKSKARFDWQHIATRWEQEIL